MLTPDQIDMMSDNEVRLALRDVVSQKCSACPAMRDKVIFDRNQLYIERWWRKMDAIRFEVDLEFPNRGRQAG